MRAVVTPICLGLNAEVSISFSARLSIADTWAVVAAVIPLDNEGLAACLGVAMVVEEIVELLKVRERLN
jgi:hypothetical protein